MLFNSLATAAVLLAAQPFSHAHAAFIGQNSVPSTPKPSAMGAGTSKNFSDFKTPGLPPPLSHDYDDNSTLSSFLGVNPDSPKPYEDSQAYLNGLAFVRGIVAAGGVDGYNKYIAAKGGGAFLNATVLEPPNSSILTARDEGLEPRGVFDLKISVVSAVAYTTVVVEVIDQHMGGDGGAWGVGLGSAIMYGDWYWQGWATNLKDVYIHTTAFEIFFVLGGITLKFYDEHDAIVASAVCLGVGTGVAVGFKGDFRWYPIA